MSSFFMEVIMKLREFCKQCQNWKSIDFYGRKINTCMCDMNPQKCDYNKWLREKQS